MVGNIQTETQRTTFDGTSPNDTLHNLFEVQTACDAITEALNTPDPVYLYDKLLQAGEIILLFGDTGIGKSIAALMFAVHVANNGHIVALLDLELSKKQFQRRCVDDNGRTYPMPTNLYRIGYSRLKNVPKNIDYTAFFIQSLKRVIEQLKPDLIIIDNLTKIAAGDTDTAKAAIPIIEALNELKETGLTILVLEHNKKVDPSRPIQLNDLQGSKMKANLVDSIITIGRSHRDNNLRYIKQVKVRDGEHVYDTDNVMVMELNRSKGYLTFNHIGYSPEYDHLKTIPKSNKAELIDKVKAMYDNGRGKSQNQIAKELGFSVGVINKYVHASGAE